MTAKRIVMYALLGAVAFLTLFPFYWMLVLATHDRGTIFNYPPPLVPGDKAAVNYRQLVETVPFWRNFWNSLYTAGMGTLATLFFCSLGGFGFAMYDFRFKEPLFAVLVATLMIPSLLGIIPYYLIMQWLGWLNHPRALYVPGMASAFGIFLMRQYIASAIPRDLMDAARIDGCREFTIFR
ncbi:MAG: carbohydrate ABC transporter permease, partial [Firmicutes bacterium]|nr:carbohydrate ABC transporter permease [Bacillota bacterium]